MVLLMRRFGPLSLFQPSMLYHYWLLSYNDNIFLSLPFLFTIYEKVKPSNGKYVKTLTIFQILCWMLIPPPLGRKKSPIYLHKVVHLIDWGLDILDPLPRLEKYIPNFWKSFEAFSEGYPPYSWFKYLDKIISSEKDLIFNKPCKRVCPKSRNLYTKHIKFCNLES